MELKSLLFSLTEHSEQIYKLDAEFMDRVVHMLNKIQTDEEDEVATLSGGGNQSR